MSTDGQWHLRVHLRAHTNDGAEKPDASGTQAQQEGKPWHGTFSLYIYQNSLSGYRYTFQNCWKYRAMLFEKENLKITVHFIIIGSFPNL